MSSLPEQVVLFVVGWLTGLSGPIILYGIRRRRKGSDLRSVLQTDLMELQYRLAIAVQAIRMRHGLDKATLQWLRPIVANYRGLNPSENLLASIDGLLAMRDDAFSKLTETQKASEDTSLSLIRYEAPFLESKFSELTLLDTELQNHLYEIRTNLAMLSEDVELSRYYFRLTFGDLSEVNRSRVVKNISGIEVRVARRAQQVADAIGRIRWPA